MSMELILGLCLGVGLAAASGLRVFIPLFVMSLSARAGYLQLAEGFEWAGSWPALVMFTVATLLEIGAFYIPWIDNVLDVAATPAAMIAGMVTTAVVVVDAHPMLQWTAAIIGGAGVAGIVQTASVATRASSTLTTGGLGNFMVSTFEWLSAVVMSVMSVLLPIVGAAIAIALSLATIILLTRRRRMRSVLPPESTIHS